jgi:hypothetical protein
MSDERSVPDGIPPAEAARIRRRDRDLTAEERDLMRPGMGKVFKQILDRQARAAQELVPRKAGRSKGRRRKG